MQSSITLDLHGKNVYQAKVSIDAALRRAGGAYRLCLIHGYLRGDAIKTMMHEEYSSHPAVIAIKDGENAGRTDLVLRRI